MKRVNTFYFYHLGEVIQPLTEFDSETLFNWKAVSAVLSAKIELSKFLQKEVIPFRMSMTSAKTLLDLIKSIVPDNINLFSADGEKAVNNLPLGYKSYYIGNAAKEFKTVLSAELESTDTYFVSRKSIFDTTDLISSSTNVFPENIRAKLPSETITDFQEAGRCLAFELSTACGFHLVRAIESVIHKYYEHITSGQKLQLKPSERNWGSYIKKLQDANADASVLSVLDHIRSLHRNPLMHPDDVLTSDEALSLWGIVQSAIIAMYKKMETKVVNLPLPQKKTSP